jgi:hypothetical protein
MLIIMAMMMLITSNLARKESKVVMVPEPAVIGKARGTIEAVAGLSSSLQRLIPKTISMAIKKIIKAPASAKELISIPMRFKIY